jgi:hypothetical protein
MRSIRNGLLGWGLLATVSLGYAQVQKWESHVEAKLAIQMIALPANTLTIDLSGVATEASWSIGAIAESGADARVTLMKTGIRKTVSGNSLEGLADLPQSYVTMASGSCRISMPAADTSGVGIFVQVPAGTILTVMVDGKTLSSSAISSSLLLQDGTLKSTVLHRFTNFMMAMQKGPAVS